MLTAISPKRGWCKIALHRSLINIMELPANGVCLHDIAYGHWIYIYPVTWYSCALFGDTIGGPLWSHIHVSMYSKPFGQWYQTGIGSYHIHTDSASSLSTWQLFPPLTSELERILTITSCIKPTCDITLAYYLTSLACSPPMPQPYSVRADRQSSDCYSFLALQIDHSFRP